MRISYFHVVIMIFTTLVLFSNKIYANITTESKSAILIDTASGRTLYEKNADISIPPASMSKMMTIYVIFDALKKGKLKLTDKFYVSENAWRQEGSRMFLKVNEKVSVEDLLKGAIIQSGNDACIALAEGFAGSVDGFVILMNEMAKKLELTHSSFANPTGLPHINHRMSVRDLAMLGRFIVKDFPNLYQYYSIKEFTWNNIKQKNRNALLGYFKDADGIKTGHTKEAGYCLVGSAKRDNMRLISVVSGLKSNKLRHSESVKILGYGFSIFETLTFKSTSNIVKLPVYRGAQKYVPVTFKTQANILIKKTDRDQIKTNIVYNAPLIAPLKKGTIVGKVMIKIPNQKKPITHDIVTTKSVETAPYLDLIWSSIQYYLWGAPKFNSDIAL